MMDRTIYMVAYNEMISAYSLPGIGKVKDYALRITTEAFAQRSHCEERVKELNTVCKEECPRYKVEYIVWPITVKSNI